MENNAELETTLRRLIAVQWQIRSDRFESHKALVHEYFRRSALWAKSLNCVDKWPIVDLALYADESIRADKTVVDTFLQHLDNAVAPPTEMKFLLIAALHWAALKTRILPQYPALHDPYEPMIVLYERGGFFCRTHDGIEISYVTTISRKGWESYNVDTPYVDLDPILLDEIDKHA